MTMPAETTVTTPAAVAALDQLVADVAERSGVDQATVAAIAPLLVEAGAKQGIDMVIAALDTDCRAYADSLAGKQRIGAHLATGAMVSKLKLLRRMTEGT